MNAPFRAVAVLLLTAALLAGCGKKNEGAVDPAAPGAEQLPTPSPIPDAASAEDAAAAAEDSQQYAAFEAWFKKYNLNLDDPKVLDSDADGDGFTNREEFLADTDPRNSESRPGLHKSLRLHAYNEVKLPIMLRNVEGGVAEIERVEGGASKREKVRQGQSIPGSSLRVAKVESRMDTDKEGVRTDMSQLVLEDTAARERHVLVKDLPVKTSATSATLIADDGTKKEVREGETFESPTEPGVSYQVLELREEQVIVKQVDTGATLTIPKVN